MRKILQFLVFTLIVGNLSVVKAQQFSYGNGTLGSKTFSPGTYFLDDVRAHAIGTIGSIYANISYPVGSDFKIGDLVLLIDMSCPSPTKNWEYQTISSVVKANSVQVMLYFANPLLHDYTNGQVIKIYQYTDVTINAGAVLTCNEWDAVKGHGGVLPLLVSGGLTINGDIDVSGKGFSSGSAGDAGVSGGGGPGGSDKGINGGVSVYGGSPKGNAGWGGAKGYSGGVGSTSILPPACGSDITKAENKSLVITSPFWILPGGGGGGGAGGNGGDGAGGSGGDYICPDGGPGHIGEPGGKGGKGAKGGEGGGLIIISAMHIYPVNGVHLIAKGLNGENAPTGSNADAATSGGKGGDARLGWGAGGGNGADGGKGGNGGNGGAGGSVWVTTNASPMLHLSSYVNISEGIGGIGAKGGTKGIAGNNAKTDSVTCPLIPSPPAPPAQKSQDCACDIVWQMIQGSDSIFEDINSIVGNELWHYNKNLTHTNFTSQCIVRTIGDLTSSKGGSLSIICHSDSNNCNYSCEMLESNPFGGYDDPVDIVKILGYSPVMLPNYTFCDMDSTAIKHPPSYRSICCPDTLRALPSDGNDGTDGTNGNPGDPGKCGGEEGPPIVVTVQSGFVKLCTTPPTNVVLTATSGHVAYEWFDKDGVSQGEKSPDSTFLTPFGGDGVGRWEVKIYDEWGNVIAIGIIDVVDPDPTPVIMANGPTTFCPGGNVILDAGSGYSAYRWSTNDISQTITVTTSGNYCVTVTDEYGCQGSTCRDVIVEDNENPIINCTPVVVCNDAGVCNAYISLVPPTATDNCGIFSILTNNLPDASGTYPVGTTPLLWTATDKSNNTATCIQSITVNDCELPTIICPQNQIRSTDLGVCTYTVQGNEFDPICFDNCPNIGMPINDFNFSNTLAGAVLQKGSTTINWTVKDASMNSASCTFIVTVNDNEPPIIGCSANIFATNEPCIQGAVVSYVYPSATDNCPGLTILRTQGPASGSFFPMGTTTITFKATDASGNFSSCSFNINVSNNGGIMYDTCNTISGFKFKDLNGDGFWGGFGEIPLYGWTINLSNSSGLYRSCVTLLDGSYEFKNLPSDTYTITEVPQTGWTETTPNAPRSYTLTVSGGQSYINYNFGNRPCVSPPPLMNNWWPLDETSEPMAIDNAGICNLGHYINISTANKVAGKVQGALEFNNPNQSVAVYNHSDLNFGTSDFSIDAWINISNETGDAVILKKLQGNIGYYFYVSNAKLKLQLGDGNLHTYTSTISLSTNRWHHVAVNVNRHAPYEISFYVDGSQADLGGYLPSQFGSIDNSISLSIGGTTAINDILILDEIETFTRLLNHQEIFDIFNSDYNGKCKDGGSICGFKFKDLNRNGIYDLGEPKLAGWEITLSGGPTIKPSVFTDASGYYCFEGLEAGTYTLSEVIQPLWYQTRPILPFSYSSYTFILSDGQSVPEMNFGNRDTLDIGLKSTNTNYLNACPTNCFEFCPNDADIVNVIHIKQLTSFPFIDSSYTIRWQYSLDGNIFTDIPGANDTVYSFVLLNTQYFRCHITKPATSLDTYSNEILFILDNPPPVSVSITPSSNPVCMGNPVMFTATPVNGGTTPSYQWQVNGLLLGSNIPVFEYTPANGDIITCTLTSSEFCVTSNPATSNSVIMEVKTTPAPTGDGVQSFCSINHPILADIQAEGNDIRYYINDNGTLTYEVGTMTVENQMTYLLSQTLAGCESNTYLAVTVILSDPPAPIGNAIQTFSNSATVSNLVASGTSIKWYASIIGGAPLASSEPLTNGNHYYASQTINGCESESRLDVTVYICNSIENVINNQNSGSGSLRNAIASVCHNGTITFASALDGQTINLTSGLIIIDKNITFDNSNHTLGITISSNGDNITINTGKTLTLASGSKVTLRGKFKNNAGVSGLVIASGASLINNTCEVAATVQRALNNGWHLFGSPFKQGLGASLARLTPTGGSVQLKPYINGSNWNFPVTSSAFNLLPGVGYAVKPSLDFTTSLTGTLFCTQYVNTINLVYSGNLPNQSWNLLANPYTSYLNWSLLGKTNISTTLYLWDNTLYPNIPPIATTTYFRTYNSTNGVGVPSGTSGFIAPLQGFFVKANYSNPKLTFPTTALTHATSPYYKEASNTEILLRLKAETDLGYDELVVCKNINAEKSFDEFDSEKMFNDLRIEMYTQSSTGERLVINTINNTNTIIPLGIIGRMGDKAKLTAFDLESNEQVYLEDRYKGKLISLTENTSCEFEFPTEEISGRFFIRFGDLNSPLINSDIDVFENDHLLNIIAQIGEEVQEIEVFTITGASVFKVKVGGSNVFTTKLDLSSAIYLVRVKTSITTHNVKISWK